jgi:hypothetical protein
MPLLPDYTPVLREVHITLTESFNEQELNDAKFTDSLRNSGKKQHDSEFIFNFRDPSGCYHAVHIHVLLHGVAEILCEDMANIARHTILRVSPDIELADVAESPVSARAYHRGVIVNPGRPVLGEGWFDITWNFMDEGVKVITWWQDDPNTIIGRIKLEDIPAYAFAAVIDPSEVRMPDEVEDSSEG